MINMDILFIVNDFIIMSSQRRSLRPSRCVEVPRVLQLLPLTGLVEAPDYERPSYGSLGWSLNGAVAKR